MQPEAKARESHQGFRSIERQPSSPPTRLARALHARCRVHRVAEDAELGQLGADEAGHAGSSVQADADVDRLVVVRHPDFAAAPEARKGIAGVRHGLR